MASHNAVGQMLGYLYQARYALYLLLESDEADFQISLEKFDDIAFEDNGSPIELIQVKHHSTPASLIDTSVDLWRTLNVWFDAVISNPNIHEHTDFLIITTADIPDDSAASNIQSENYTHAFDLLKAATEIPSKTNNSYYQKFNQISREQSLNLIKKIRIISSESNIVDIEKKIEKHIKYSCKPQYLSAAMERIEGWWFQECIKALCSDNLVIATQNQLHATILEITRQYDDDNLPIEFWNTDGVEEDSLNPKDRVFLEQLRLLSYQNRTLRLAIQDYYRASIQRSIWLRQGLVITNDLDVYEHRLIDAWEHAFAEMEESLRDYDHPTEEEKIKEGKSLYQSVMKQDIRIRAQVSEPYVMHGTYHRLANSLSAGWHIDFAEQLRALLEGAPQS